MTKPEKSYFYTYQAKYAVLHSFPGKEKCVSLWKWGTHDSSAGAEVILKQVNINIEFKLCQDRGKANGIIC